MASAVAMDKVVFKDLMRGHDLPVVDYTWFRRGSVARRARAGAARGRRDDRGAHRRQASAARQQRRDDPGPRAAGELPAALDEAFRYDTKVIVEAYVAGARELECGVLGNDEPIVFEPGEVISHHEWYDYEAKYVDGLADVTPPPRSSRTSPRA